MPYPWVKKPLPAVKSFAPLARVACGPKTQERYFFVPKEGGFGAFSVSSARGFLSGRSALKYKRENRKFLYQTFLFRFLEFCLGFGFGFGVKC
jgi:hypothetical protein